MDLNINLEPCIAPPWATTGHLQTILSHYLPNEKSHDLDQRIFITLPDQDQLTGKLRRGDSPFVVVLFHGLSGDTESDYMIRTAQIASHLGHTVVRMNHRGCGFGRGLARGPYHSGRGDDISEVIQFLRRQFPRKKIIAAGFSLGANALLTLLTGQRGQHLPDQAIAVNGPIDLQACAHKLRRGLNRVYDFRFVQACRRDIHFRQRSQLTSVSGRVPYFSYLTDIDNLYTAPEGGFRNAEDYYRSCSTAPYLHKIKIPTVLLMSQDDPFLTWEPYENARGNPHIALYLQKSGGHIGYLGRSGKSGYYRWLDYAMKKFFQGLTETASAK